MSKQNIQILVLGAGYAGMMAALRLSGKTKKQGVDITLVSSQNVFIQRPRLHHVATGQAVTQKPIADMLRGSRVIFRQGWVTALHPNVRRVTLETGQGSEELAYDYLVYALGSVVDRDSVPGVPQHAYVFDPVGDRSATDLHQRLLEMGGRTGKVVVVGGGPTGIEGATEIKGLFPNLQVSLVTSGQFGAFKDQRVEPHFRDGFRKQGIPILENRAVESVTAGELTLDGGQVLPFDLLLWAGGFRAQPLARQAGLVVNERGQILVDPTLASISHPNIYAIGDAAQTIDEPGVPLRMGLLPALTMGAHVADNLTALIKGKPQKPLSFAYYGQGISMGPDDAVGFSGYPAEAVMGPILRGRLGVWIRNFFVWLLFFILDVERRRPGFYFWLGKGRYAAQQRATRRTRGLRPYGRDIV
jgi:NADH dehydrogenase FAD-containing subunit